MNKKLSRVYIFIFAAILYGGGLTISNSNTFGLCQPHYQLGYLCTADAIVNVGWALMTAAQVFVVVGIVMLFANECGWRKWLKFSYWYVPITAVTAIWAFPMPFFMNEISRDIAVRDFGITYIAITLIIVIWAGVAKLRERVHKTT